MNLSEFRAQYPQYNDLSDDDLAQGLYAKHYSDMPFAEFASQIGYTPEEPPEQSPWRRAADVGLSALKGAIAVPEAAVGLLNLGTGGEAGRVAEEAGFRPAEARTWLDELKSDAQKKADREVAEAEGFVDTGAAMLKNPSTIGHAIVESLPAMGAGGVVGRGIVAAAPRVAPFLAGAAGEGTVGAGLAAEEIRQQSQDGTLTAGQVGAAFGSGAGTALFGAVGGRIAQRLGVADVDTLLAGGGVSSVDGVMKRILAGGITEGVFEEMPQSMQEQVWMNAALGKPLLEGVPESAAQGLIVGAAMGGGVGALVRDRAGITPEPSRDILDLDSPEVRAITDAPSAGEAIAAAARAMDTPATEDAPGEPTAMAAAMQAAMDRQAVAPATTADLEQAALELDLPTPATPDTPAPAPTGLLAEPATMAPGESPTLPPPAAPAAVELPPTQPPAPPAPASDPIPALQPLQSEAAVAPPAQEASDARPLEDPAESPRGAAAQPPAVPAVDRGGAAAAIPPGKQPGVVEEGPPAGTEDFHTRRGELKTFTSAERARVYLANRTNRVPGDFVPRQVARGDWRLSRRERVRTPAQQANDRRLAARARNARPTDDALTVLRKSGGLNRLAMVAEGADPAGFKGLNRRYIGLIRAEGKGGLTMDGAAEILAAHGFDVHDENGVIDASKAAEIIHDSFNGTERYTMEGQELRASKDAEAQAQVAQADAENAATDEVTLEETGYNALTEEEQDAVAEFLASAEDVKWADEGGEAVDFTEANALAREGAENAETATGGQEDRQGPRGADLGRGGQEVQRAADQGEGGRAQAARAEARSEVAEPEGATRQPAAVETGKQTPSSEGVAVSGVDAALDAWLARNEGAKPSLARLQTRKGQDGRVRLYFVGTNNEAAPGETFASAQEARGWAGALESRFGERGRSRVAADNITSTKSERPALDLRGETESEIRAREAREAKDREAKAKQEAAPPPSDFVLTGSNSKADQARARGQMELAPAGEAQAERIADFGEKIGGARKDTAQPLGSRVARDDGGGDEPGWRKRFEVSQVAKSTDPAEEGQWAVYDSKKTDWKGQPRQIGELYPTKEAAEKAVELAALAVKHRVVMSNPNADGKSTYTIWRDVTDRKRVQVVNRTFDTREEAMRYMVEHAVEIVETKTNFGEEILAKPEVVVRTGKERRDGPATAKMFSDTFGFRGVEFGNWNNQDERQEVMNHAFDGLLDLSEAINVPPRALSLNGDLALAFGARGQGLTGARAHYERTYGVVNLTKMQGAGALAHEWLHAVDHYLGRQDGKAPSERVKNDRGDLVFDTKGVSDYASHGFRAVNSGVREELRVAYRDLIQTMFTKAEKYVVDTERAEKFVGKARDNLAETLQRIRDDLARQRTYGKRNNAPATAEQLATFDTLATRLVEGQDLKTAYRSTPPTAASKAYGTLSGRWTNDTLEGISAVLKAVRGRSGFNSEGKGDLDGIRYLLNSYSERVEMLASARRQDEKTKRVPTAYAMDAKTIDQGRASDYWTTEHEMAARAFSAYIEDKIAASGNRSDFLSYGSDNKFYRIFNIRPFPEGAERETINAAFDHLFATIQTRETDQGVAMFSRQGRNFEQLKMASQETDAGRIFANRDVVFGSPLKEEGLFTLRDADGRPDGSAQTMFYRLYDRTRKVNGKHPKIGYLRTDVRDDGAFLNVRLIQIDDEVRQTDAGFGETVVASMLASNPPDVKLEIIDIVVADDSELQPGEKKVDARPFWKKMGTQWQNYSSDPNVQMDGWLSRDDYLRARGEGRSLFRRGSDQSQPVRTDPRGEGQEPPSQRGGEAARGERDGSGARPGRAPREAQDGLDATEAPARGLSASEARAEVVAAFGERATARLEQLGLLNFTSRVSQWPEAMRRGAQGNEYGVYHNGKAYYALDNIPAGEVVRTVLHEVGEHFGLKGMLGEKAYAKLGAAVTAAHKARERSVHAAWLHVESTYPYEPGSEKFLAEVIAKVGEDQKVHSRSWWKQMVDAIRSFLIKLGLNTNMIRRVVAEDLQLLLRASVRHAARGEASEPSMLTEAAFARGDDLVAREAALRREILDAEDAIGYHTKQLNAARKFAPRHHPDEAAELIRQEERSVRNATKALERARSEHAKVAKELERLPAIDDPRNQLPLFSRTDGAPTFYSDLARQVEGIKTESAPASQWIGTLKGLKGVKVDELEWSGVLDWLGTREGKVTKAEVQAFLEQNGVKVEETMLGGEASATSRMDQLIVDLDSRGYSLLRENDPNTQQRVIVGLLERGTNERLDFIPGEGFGSPRGLEIPSSVERIGRELAGLEEQTWADEEYADPGETKFSQYTLPGGQNYRELLLTLPEKLRTPGPMPSFEDWLAEQPWRQGGPYVTEHNQRVLYKQWVERESKTKVADFRSSHFDQPNILAHVRFDERTDAEGKRVLFIEEFQSDWAQKGKREGFDTPETRAEQAEAKRRVEEIDAKIQEIHAEYGDGDGNHARFLRELPAEVQDRYADLVKAREDVGFKARYGQRVPAAPFVGKTEAWVALAVKRMVKYAVDNGFDRVAWTRGDQQADRYSLRKQVDSISWESVDAKMNGNGASRRVNISLKEPHRQLMNLGVNEDGVVVGARFGRDHDQFTGKRLEEVIGKTATEKVMGSPNGYLADEGLNIGGEGMIAFYDRIVPGTIRDVLRKLGVRAHAAGPQTEGPQVVRDRGLVNTQAIRDLALSQAFVDKGFEGLDAKAKRLVQAGMLALSKDDQILKAVVRAVPVDVVNVLRAKKLSPEMFFHDPAMLVNDLARDLRADMPGGVDVGTALVRAIAKAGAEDVAARAPRVTGGAVERVAASGAFANGHGEIVRLIDIPGLGPQPGFDITPALRERAAGGMPMFSRPQLPGVPPAQGSGPPRRNTPLGLQGGQAGNNASWDAPAPGKLDNLLYTLQDKHIDTKRVVQAVRASGREIADRWNPYLQEELYHGRTAKGTTEFIEKELKPLVVDMATRKVGMAEFEEYLHARHAEERNVQIAKVNPEMPDGGSGMETADARAYLAGLDPGKRRAYEALAKRVDAITKNTRQALVDYHLESPETVQAWEAAYGSYVPLMRDDDTGMGTGQGYSVKGSSSKRATGSSREVVNIIANIAMQRERAITRGEKNRVALALYGLAKMNPNPSFWKTDMPPTIRTVNEATGLVQDTVDPLYKSRDNVVMARVRNPKTGQISELSVIFNERDERAMRMSGSLKNIDADQLGVVLGTSAKITRYFASINTQYNPVFGVVNLTRDFQGALVNLSSTPLAGKQRVIIGDTLSALRGVYIDSRDQRKGVAPTSSWANLWEEFQREGGQTGYRDMFRTSKDRADAIASELKKITEGKAKKVGRAVFNWLDDYNNAMENAVRLAAYKAGKNQGLTNQQAASIAKNLTVNFNRKGQAALQAGALYAFFNASVQGTTRLAQTLAGPAGKKIVLGGLILGSLQALMLAAAGYDEDEPPEFLRERSLIIPIGERRYVSVPMPLGLHVLPNLSRIATEFALSGFKAPGKRIAQLVGVLVEAFNPIGTSGLSVQTIAPTAVDPLVALAENRDWTGKPIAREDMNPLQPTPGHTRSRDTASWWGKHISEGINFLSGGTKYTPGIASPTPDQVDYLIGQVTGGLGRETTKLAETVESQITGEELPPYKIPLVGRFYGNADSQSSQTSRFYANLKELGAHELEVKGRIKDRQSPAAYIKEHPEARLYPLADKTERDVSKLRKQKRELLAQEASRDRIRLIESQINAMMTRFNERVDEAKRAAAAP